MLHVIHYLAPVHYLFCYLIPALLPFGNPTTEDLFTLLVESSKTLLFSMNDLSLY